MLQRIKAWKGPSDDVVRAHAAHLLLPLPAKQLPDCLALACQSPGCSQGFVVLPYVWLPLFRTLPCALGMSLAAF